ncbi:hypothetical protein V9K67_09455 [Paraflavisolibacter sp. H34]|uniref:hypothetical protein n=1 Tax=Huijunlia imazamoxiresistens TaxID=3127457 RepID=UPI0030190233
MTRIFLFIAFALWSTYAQGQGHLAPDSAGLKNADNDPAKEEIRELYYEVLPLSGKLPVQLKVFRNTNGYFNIHLAYTHPAGEFPDSTYTVKSVINLNEHFSFAEFDVIVKQLVAGIPAAQDQKQIADYRLSDLYMSIMQKIKNKNSPELIDLRSRLDAYEQMDERQAIGGVFKLKNDTVSTYRTLQAIRPLRNIWLKARRQMIRGTLRPDTAAPAGWIAQPGRKEENYERVRNEVVRYQKRLNPAADSNAGETRRTALLAVSAHLPTALSNRLAGPSAVPDANSSDPDQIRRQPVQPLTLRDSLIHMVAEKDPYLIAWRKRRSFKKLVMAHLTEKTKGAFILDSAFFKFFNNAVDKMAIYGTYYSDTANGKRPGRRIAHNHPIRAHNNSFGLRALNVRTNQHFVVNSGSVNQYSIRLSDLFEYVPQNENFSYIVKDQSFMLRAGGPQQNQAQALRRRSLYDYLTAITFLDFLGLNNNLNNNFIQLEGRSRFPLRLSTAERPAWMANTIWLPMFEAYLNASFVNGNNINGAKSQVFAQNKDTLFYDYFDLVRNYNIKTGFSLGLAAFQFKSIHSRIYVNWEGKMYRTAFSYTSISERADSIYDTNIFSLSQGLSLLFEYRPDFNIGADLRLSWEPGVRPLSNKNNTLKYIAGQGPVFKDAAYKFQPLGRKEKGVLGLELNAYTFINPLKEKNDGLFFRLAAYTNRSLTQISPYLLIGYATSLKGLVKKNSEAGKIP